MEDDNLFNVNDITYIIYPIYEPDSLILNFVFNEEGNTSLKHCNELNKSIHQLCGITKLTEVE